MAEVVVIGGGVGGLAAAIDLARRDHRVTLLEAHHELGGKVGREVVDDVEFDTGPSLLTLPDVLCELLDEPIDLVRHASAFRYTWPDGVEFTTHATIDATCDEAAATFDARSADELRNFFGYARTIWEEAAPVFVYGDSPSMSTIASLGLRALRSFRRIDPFRTMTDAIDAHVTNPHLRDVLYRYATYNGSDPRRAPATLNCIAHVEHGLGAWGIRGGMYELVRALTATADRLGVAIRCDTPVDRVTVEGDRVVGVEAAGERFRADAVVANADVRHVFDDLLSGEDHPDQPPSTSGWTAVIRASRDTERAPHTVLFPRRYAAEFEALFDRGEVPDEPTIYVCAQEAAHERKGWRDHEPLFVMVNAPARSTFDDSHIERTVLRRLREAHVIASDDSVVWRRTPDDLAARFPGSGGALYGAASNSRWAAFQRPANRCATPRGLYLASGSAHPGGGVPLALLSGRAAARALHADSAATKRLRSLALRF